jgi:hypothetical protein
VRNSQTPDLHPVIAFLPGNPGEVADPDGLDGRVFGPFFYNGPWPGTGEGPGSPDNGTGDAGSDPGISLPGENPNTNPTDPGQGGIGQATGGFTPVGEEPTVNPTPVPGSVLLLGSGLAAIGWLRRKSGKKG